MILTSALPFPKSYRFLVHHGIRISKHAFKLVVVSGVVAGLSFVVINLALLTMQISSLPLFLKVANINLSLQTPDSAKVQLNNYGLAQSLKIDVQGQVYQTTAQTAGIKLDTNAILHSIQHPGGWNEIPLIYAFNNLHRSFPLRYAINNQSLTAYLGKVKLPIQKAPASASIIIPQKVAQPAYITTEEPGYLYTTGQLVAQVTQAVAQDKQLQVMAQPKILKPAVAANQLTNQLSRTNSLLNSNLTISNGSKNYKITAGDLRQIVTVTTAANGLAEPDINHAQLVELLRAHSNIFYKAPTSTKISTLDGNQVAKTDGASGQAISIVASADQIAKALQNGQSTQTVTMAAVSPNTTYLRNYTATNAGLSALIKDFAASHSGSYKVVTMELTGNRSAFFNEEAAIVPASTYKLFVSYVALKKIEEGTLSFSSQTSAGSLDTCMHKMILVSDNTCAKAILGLAGWSQAESMVMAAGFKSTNINNSGGGYMSSTASDIAKLLKGFYDGSLLSASSTAYLFNLMENQVYRSGIPAGSPGATVADKVGFLNSWNHDAAIVYGPHTTYLLVIMTTNSSFSQIKDLSSQIYNLYSQ